jgi:hypothetical protein
MKEKLSDMIGTMVLCAVWAMILYFLFWSTT